MGIPSRGYSFVVRFGDGLAGSAQVKFLASSLQPLPFQRAPCFEKAGHAKAGFHAFRRYRLTWLRKNRVYPDLERFWMGHEDETVGDGYSKMKEDVTFRLEQAEKVGLGFACCRRNRECPHRAPNSLASIGGPPSARQALGAGRDQAGTRKKSLSSRPRISG